MRRLLTLVVMTFVVMHPLYAQNIKVQKFSLLESDLSANTRGTSKLDQNGETAALIKIQTPERGFTFDGGSLGIVGTEEHAGEIWLYVPRRAQKLIVSHKDYGVMRDYFYPIPISGGRTYEMYIDIGIGRYATITSQMANSTIYIDGENCGLSPVNHKYLRYGPHTIRALKDRYEGEKTVMITTNDAEGLQLINVAQRDMSDHFGDVTISVDNKADIYFEDHKVGTSSWMTQLREGSYVVETRKADCEPVKTSFKVVARQQNTVKAAAPIPFTGWLNIYTRPGNVSATYNGTTPIELGQAQTMPIGSYQLSFNRKGYVPQQREYVVKHNEVTKDTVTLSRIQYVKPRSFYFGAGYTFRQLGGITALAGATYMNYDLQLSYTFGLGKSEEVHWYSTDGNDTYQGTVSYKRSTFAIKAGYLFVLTERIGIYPQLGFEMEQLSANTERGSIDYGNKASAKCVSVGAKVVFAPIERFCAFVNPAYSIAVNKDENFKLIENASDINAGGFQLTAGVIFNF